MLSGKPITVTDPAMTRFMMTLALNYAKFVERGEERLTQSSHGETHDLHNTTRLDVEGMKALLLKLDVMQRIARGEPVVAEE